MENRSQLLKMCLASINVLLIIIVLMCFGFLYEAFVPASVCLSHNGFDVFRFLYDACGPASAAHHNCFDVFSLFI